MSAQPDDLSDLTQLFDEFNAKAIQDAQKPNQEFVNVMSEYVGHDQAKLADTWLQYRAHMESRVEYYTGIAVNQALDLLRAQYMEAGDTLDQDGTEYAEIVSYNAAQAMLNVLWEFDLVDMDAFITTDIE